MSEILDDVAETVLNLEDTLVLEARVHRSPTWLEVAFDSATDDGDLAALADEHGLTFRSTGMEGTLQIGSFREARS